MKNQIEPLLKELQSSQRALAKALKEFNKAETDLAAFTAEIEKIGEPRYTDDEAVNRLATLRVKCELCTKAIESLGEKTDKLTGDLHELLGPAGMLAANLVGPILDRRLETITAVFKPFFYHNPDGAASDCAAKTDCYQQGHRALQHYAMLQTRTSNYNQTPERVLKAAKEVEAVLTEGLKDVPDLVQFLPSMPSPSDVNEPALAGAADEQD